jgi:hypothetical protein
VFLGRSLKAPQVRRVDRASKSKVVHVIHLRHRDEVEAPITDWLQEAYDLSDRPASQAAAKHATSKPKPAKKKTAKAKASPRATASRKATRR